MIVHCTREGLPGQKTASGYTIDTQVPFVALPAHAALYQWVSVSNPLNGLTCRALVLDVGPWNINDNAYVFGGARPQAESGVDLFGRKTNLAGIDLGGYVFAKLGILDNATAQVAWEFLALPISGR